MKLSAFRISMYKGILDSDWVDVNSLTVLVGKNESGKTSLLKALHKLNPYSPEPYDIKKEWPRGRLPEHSQEHVVCRARFRLTDEEKSDLARITGIEKIPDIVGASRNYAGQLEVNFEEDISFDGSPPIEIDTAGIEAIFDQFPKVQQNFSNEFKKSANDCLQEVRRLASEERFIELRQLTQKHEPLLRGKRVQSTANSYNTEGQFINTYLASLEELTQHLHQLPTTQLEVNDYLIKRLPKFIYMDDYRIFTGAAQLDEIKTRQDNNSLTEADKTFITILSLSGLDIDQLVKLEEGGIETIRERQNALVGGGESLTKIISTRFSQRDYEIDYRVDGQYFFTNVKDGHDPTAIELEERSRGFQ